MGINKNNLRFLLLAKKNGTDFSQTAMIGRQTLNMPENHFLEVMKNESGIKITDNELKEIYSHRYAEKLLTLLGAQVINSFDYSDYEKATYTHDFNLPIADEFKNRYSVVIDGGSLEHIFNFPVAIGNCMEMVKLNGHFIGLTPANNNFGHGFYQFSPELFYRVLSPQNGYKVNSMYYYDNKFSNEWMSIEDPDKVGSRSILVNTSPVMITVLAQKIEVVKLFRATPQQSDYTVAWKEPKQMKSKGKSILSKIKNSIPITFKVWFYGKSHSKPNPKFFRKVNMTDLLKK
ncbi:MAG: hypothetical protein ABI402_20315 [Ferruginibacter sp.]